jgi:hypothetical protein
MVMLQSFETTDPPPPGHSGGLTKFSGGLTKFSRGLTKFSGDLMLFNTCYASEGELTKCFYNRGIDPGYNSHYI